MGSAVLPFMFDAEVRELGGDLVAIGVPCSVWPGQSTRISDRGRHHDHRGEAALEHADALRQPNRILRLGAEAGSLAGDYNIVAATPMEILPHVVLELRRTSGLT